MSNPLPKTCKELRAQLAAEGLSSQMQNEAEGLCQEITKQQGCYNPSQVIFKVPQWQANLPQSSSFSQYPQIQIMKKHCENFIARFALEMIKQKYNLLSLKTDPHPQINTQAKRDQKKTTVEKDSLSLFLHSSLQLGKHQSVTHFYFLDGEDNRQRITFTVEYELKRKSNGFELIYKVYNQSSRSKKVTGTLHLKNNAQKNHVLLVIHWADNDRKKMNQLELIYKDN